MSRSPYNFEPSAKLFCIDQSEALSVSLTRRFFISVPLSGWTVTGFVVVVGSVGVVVDEASPKSPLTVKLSI